MADREISQAEFTRRLAREQGAGAGPGAPETVEPVTGRPGPGGHGPPGPGGPAPHGLGHAAATDAPTGADDARPALLAIPLGLWAGFIAVGRAAARFSGRGDR